MQSFAVFSPPEAANASSPSNFIPGGVTTKEGYLAHYDANTNNIRDLFNQLGISRTNIQNTTKQYLNSKRDGLISWGLTSRYSYAQGERSYTIRTDSGGTRTFYYRPLTLWDTYNNVTNGSNYYVFVGQTSDGMWFGLMLVCGNLVLKIYPPQPKCPAGYVGEYPNCTVPPKMCTIPGKESLPENSPNCKPEPVARCDSLKITKLLDNYQLTGEGYAANGASISSYVFVIKKTARLSIQRQLVLAPHPQLRPIQQKLRAPTLLS